MGRLLLFLIGVAASFTSFVAADEGLIDQSLVRFATGRKLQAPTFIVTCGDPGGCEQKFRAAFADACAVPGPAVVLYPGNQDNVVNCFEPYYGGTGKRMCADVTFVLDGIIRAPSEGQGNHRRSVRGCYQFHYWRNLVIQGRGMIDGRASYANWWKNDGGGKRPKMLSTMHTIGLTIMGESPGQPLRVVNQPGNAVFIDFAENTVIQDTKCEADQNSPNTDCYHIARATKGLVNRVHAHGGDDCVVLQTDCSGWTIRGLYCLGHGVSIGSLGQKGGGDPDCLRDITVEDSHFTNSMVALRIKAFPGGHGAVYNYMARRCTFDNVDTPVSISHYYPKRGRAAEGVAQNIAFYNISFINLSGTTSKEAGWEIDCNPGMPAVGVLVKNINIRSMDGSRPRSIVNNVYGTEINVNPPSGVMMGNVPGWVVNKGAAEAARCGYRFFVQNNMAGAGGAQTGGGGPKPRPRPRPRPRPKGKGRKPGRKGMRKGGMRKGGMHAKGKGMHGMRRRKAAEVASPEVPQVEVQAEGLLHLEPVFLTDADV